MFTVYTRGSAHPCIYCEKAKAALQESGWKYKEQIVGIHVQNEHFKSMFPEAKTYPVVVHDGFVVGGYTDLVPYLEELGSAPELLNG